MHFFSVYCTYDSQPIIIIIITYDMNIITNLWQFFSSVKLALFTLCALASTSIIGTIIPQGESYSFYVKNFGAKWAQFFHILDIPNMYYSWWFLGLLGLLSANLIICSLDRLPRVFKIINRDNFAIQPERMEKMAYFKKWEIPSETNQSTDFRTIFNKSGWKLTGQKQKDGEMFFRQKNRWSRIGVYVVHLSILIIFTGAIIGHFFGFKGSVMVPEMQSTTKIYTYENSKSIDLGFEIRCNSFLIEFYDNGMPKDYRSNLSVLENGKEILTTDIEVNEPLTYKGITFYQSSYEGYQDFIISISEHNSEKGKRFVLPFQQQQTWDEKSLRFGIINVKSNGQRVISSKIWLTAGDEPPVTEWLDDNTPATITAGDRTFTISAKQMYATGLQVAKDPGVWLVYVGCISMLIGLFMAFFLSHKRIWLYRQKGTDGIILYLSGSTNKNKQDFSRIFKKLEENIDSTIHHSTKMDS